eukprot:m.263435 g.263435  ORF g.263435 m.263435 type:complete len:317 (+) comp26706_c0_seq1:1625-2575(+)
MALCNSSPERRVELASPRLWLRLRSTCCLSVILSEMPSTNPEFTTNSSRFGFSESRITPMNEWSSWSELDTTGTTHRAMACVKRLHAGLSAQKTQIQTYSTQRRTTSARAVQSRLDTDARVQLPHTLVTPPFKKHKHSQSAFRHSRTFERLRTVCKIRYRLSVRSLTRCKRCNDLATRDLKCHTLASGEVGIVRGDRVPRCDIQGARGNPSATVAKAIAADIVVHRNAWVVFGDVLQVRVRGRVWWHIDMVAVQLLEQLPTWWGARRPLPPHSSVVKSDRDVHFHKRVIHYRSAAPSTQPHPFPAVVDRVSRDEVA